MLETGPDATRLRPGDWVLCNPTVRSRDGGLTPDITLQGWSARGPGGLLLQRRFRDGPFAERMRVPTENAIPIGDIRAEDAPAWCALTTLLVSGATGNAAWLGSPGPEVTMADRGSRV